MPLKESVKRLLPYSQDGGPPLPEGVKRVYRRTLINEYHRYYYTAGVWQHTSWLGVPIYQCTEDLIVMQQILWDTKPELVIETGTLFGGTSLFIATVFDAMGEGEILTVDIDHSKVDERTRSHPRVTMIEADSTIAATQERVREHAEGKRTMLYLDADHTAPAVLAELRAYGDLVTPGCYIVAADSNLNGHPVPWPMETGGPHEAVQTFLAERDDFVVDKGREYQLLTFNPDGFLLRTEK